MSLMGSLENKLAVDLFCGCGGISAGLRMSGYEVIAGLDVEPNFISTFAHNFQNAQAVSDSITELSPAIFCKQLNIEPEQLDILVGGPPCQGFSKNVPKRHRYLEDPKNLLVKSFLEYAEYLRPASLLMENVAEMKNGFDGQYTDEVLSRLSAAGYHIEHAVLNAADYGVPQRRRRAFFIGRRNGGLFQIPRATHFAKSDGIKLFNSPTHVTVWEAIGDLPSLAHGEGSEITKYSTKAFSDYQKLMRNESGFVKNHIARFLQPKQHARLNALKPGQGLKDLPINLQVKSGYSGAYGRLTKDMIAPTITRWVFHPGSGRWGHPVDSRVITIREAARIQGFPDSYEFMGTYTQQAGQLGNAVPPVLISNLMKYLNKTLDAQKDERSSVSFSKESFSSSVGAEKKRA